MKNIEDSIVTAIEAALADFRATNPTEDIYGVALVRSAVGNHVHLALATEQRLERWAANYSNNLDLEAKKKCLRWANPDDGWYQDTFSRFETASSELAAAIASGDLEEFDDRTSEIICAAISRVIEAGKAGAGVACDITHGEDPQEFVYWASQLNPEEIKRQVEAQFAESQEIEGTIDFG